MSSDRCSFSGEIVLIFCRSRPCYQMRVPRSPALLMTLSKKSKSKGSALGNRPISTNFVSADETRDCLDQKSTDSIRVGSDVPVTLDSGSVNVPSPDVTTPTPSTSIRVRDTGSPVTALTVRPGLSRTSVRCCHPALDVVVGHIVRRGRASRFSARDRKNERACGGHVQESTPVWVFWSEDRLRAGWVARMSSLRT